MVEQYSNGDAYLASNLVMEMSEFRVSRESGSTPTKTRAKGYAGETPGSPMTTVEMTGKIPAANMELDLNDYINTGKKAVFTFFVGNRKLTCEGCIFSDGVNFAIDSEVTQTLSFRGGPSKWE
jgi:hypothetical protein